MIRPTGVFMDTAQFTAYFVLKYRSQMQSGILDLRAIRDAEPEDMPILKEWKTARALLLRYASAAAAIFDGRRATLGRVWIETLPGFSATPWMIEEDDYAQTHVRTRTCLLPAPDAYSLSGLDRLLMVPGSVNVIEHRVLHSEINLSSYPRTHLIVDVKRPDDAVES